MVDETNSSNGKTNGKSKIDVQLAMAPTYEDAWERVFGLMHDGGLSEDDVVGRCTDEVTRGLVRAFLNHPGARGRQLVLREQIAAMTAALGCHFDYLMTGQGPKSAARRCSATTTDGHPCTHLARDGKTTCLQHDPDPEVAAQRKAWCNAGREARWSNVAKSRAAGEADASARHFVGPQCAATTRDGGRCTQPAKKGKDVCRLHAATRTTSGDAPVTALAVRRVAFDGADLSVQGEGNETRMRDLDLARVLGFKDPYNIRTLIGRHIKAGHVRPVSCDSQTTGRGGRPGREFWLTRLEAIQIATASNLPNGQALRGEMERAYSLATEGKLPGQQNDQIALALNRQTEVLGRILDRQDKTDERIRNLEAKVAAPVAVDRDARAHIEAGKAREGELFAQVREIQKDAPRKHQAKMDGPAWVDAMRAVLHITEALRFLQSRGKNVSEETVSLAMGNQAHSLHDWMLAARRGCFNTRGIKASYLQKVAAAMGCRPEYLVTGRGAVAA